MEKKRKGFQCYHGGWVMLTDADDVKDDGDVLTEGGHVAILRRLKYF